MFGLSPRIVGFSTGGGGGGARREDRAAGIIEGEGKAEGLADLHFGDPLQDLLWREEIEPATFVVGTEIAPGGACGAAGPALVVCHRHFLPVVRPDGAVPGRYCRDGSPPARCSR